MGSKSAEPGSGRLSHRRAVFLYLLAIVGPTLVLLYMGLQSVRRQRQAVTSLTASNLRLSGDRVVAELERRAERHFVSPVVLAKICANVGDQEQAIAYLAKAYSLRDPSLMWLKTSRPLSALHSHERFKEIVKNMNFPQ